MRGTEKIIGHAPEHQLTIEHFKNSELLNSCSEKLKEFTVVAGEMYTGAQHLRLMEGVKMLRQAWGKDCVDVAII